MSAFGAPILLDLIGPPERAILKRMANRVAYQDGEIVHDRGEVGTAFGLVVDGTVALFRTLADGRQVFVSAVEVGQSFGDAASLIDSSRTHHAVAVGNTVIDHISQDNLNCLLNEYPAIVLALYKIASFRLMAAIEMLDDSRMLKTDVRVAKMLRRMAKAHENKAVVPTLQETLCQVLGLSSVSVVKALRQLSEKGLIKTRYRRIDIPDLARFDLWLRTHDWE